MATFSNLKQERKVFILPRQSEIHYTITRNNRWLGRLQVHRMYVWTTNERHRILFKDRRMADIVAEFHGGCFVMAVKDPKFGVRYNDKTYRTNKEKYEYRQRTQGI